MSRYESSPSRRRSARFPLTSPTLLVEFKYKKKIPTSVGNTDAPTKSASVDFNADLFAVNYAIREVAGWIKPIGWIPATVVC